VLLLALAVTPLSPAASHRSAHFVVEAPDVATAGKIANAAERQLKEVAKQWLGRELPEWSEPCPITVTLEASGIGGSSTFVYNEGRVERQEMHLEGSLERILGGVLPHEIAHVVLAHHFRRPFPRWADEGGATLAEGDLELAHYREKMAQILATPERCIPLRDLFALKQYPRDIHAFYGVGFSISNYLVAVKGRRTFVDFVAAGMDGDWDTAVKKHYGFKTVEELEQAWIVRLRQENLRDREKTVKREALIVPAVMPPPRPEEADRTSLR
jgi:hypothetical protein